MARNQHKYEYVEIALLRDSALHASLVAEATETGRSLSAVVMGRLADHFRGSGQAPRPGSTPFAPPVKQQQQSSSAPAVDPRPAPEQSKAEEKEPEYDPAKAKKNAAAMLDLL